MIINIKTEVRPFVGKSLSKRRYERSPVSTHFEISEQNMRICSARVNVGSVKAYTLVVSTHKLKKWTGTFTNRYIT